MGQTNRDSKIGCATRLNYKKVKYPQTLLLKVHYETSVPYGQDRLIPIWVATLALRQWCRTIRFGTAAQMLDFFQLPKDGPPLPSLHAGRSEDLCRNNFL